MRVALHADGRTIRGNENQLLLIVRGLVARGHEVHAAVVPETPVATAFQNAGAIISGARPRGDAELVSAARFVRWLRRVKPDAVLLTSWKRAALSAALARAARAPRIVLRVGGEHHSRRGTGDALRQRALRDWVDAVYVNSQSLRDHLLAYAPALPPERVHVILNAIPPFTGTAKDIRAEIGVPPGTCIIFSAGALEPRKAYDTLLTAFAALSHPHVHLAIAGDGPDRAALLSRANTFGMADRVHLLGQRKDVRALLPSADVFALASRSDSMPNAVLEAAAAGLPIVSTAVPGVPEALGPRVDAPAAGWIVPIDDAAALAAALDESLDPGARSRGDLARHRMQHDHSPDVLVDHVEALLRGDVT